MASVPDSPAALISKALHSCVRSASFRRRVEDGRIHEDQVISALVALIQDDGLPAQMVDMVVSNYPLSARAAPSKPADYRYLMVSFLEFDGHLFRMDFDSVWDNVKGSVLNFPSRAAALTAFSETGGHYEWRPNSERGDQNGLVTLEGIISVERLKSELSSTSLRRETPIATSTSRPPRI